MVVLIPLFPALSAWYQRPCRDLGGSWSSHPYGNKGSASLKHSQLLTSSQHPNRHHQLFPNPGFRCLQHLVILKILVLCRALRHRIYLLQGQSTKPHPPSVVFPSPRALGHCSCQARQSEADTLVLLVLVGKT